jgi:hypothetical protein
MAIMNKAVLDVIKKQKMEEEIVRQRGIANNFKKYVEEWYDDGYYYPTIAHAIRKANGPFDDDYGKTFQIIKNRGETFHEYPLFIGKEYMNNAINVHLREAWLKMNVDELTKVISYLNGYQAARRLKFNKFTVQASESHGGMSNYLPDIVYPCQCELQSFDIFHNNFQAPFDSPLTVMLKLVNADAKASVVLKANGFFYITGDAELDDNYITDFRIENFCYFDRNNTLNQGQILL